MNLSQLETFLSVARTGSFTKAADLVNLTQSAVSRQVQDLEDSLGVRLLERLGRTISLTPHGKILVEDATRLLQEVKNVKDRLRDLDEEVSGDLRVGATVTAANTFLPTILADFRRKNPGVNLSLQPGQSMGLLAKIRSNELDIAITGPVEEHPGLTSCAAIDDELVLVGAPDHFLARKGTLKPNQLKGVGFISREKGSDTQTLVSSWFQQHEVRVNTVLTIPWLDITMHLVGAGLAIAAISRALVAEDIAERCFALIPVEGWPIRRALHVVRHHQKYVSRPMETLVKQLQLIASDKQRQSKQL